MKIIKEVLSFFVNPIKVIGNKNLSEWFSKFFEKYHFIIYFLAFVISFLIFIIFDQFDSFIEFFKNN